MPIKLLRHSIAYYTTLFEFYNQYCLITTNSLNVFERKISIKYNLRISLEYHLLANYSTENATFLCRFTVANSKQSLTEKDQFEQIVINVETHTHKCVFNANLNQSSSRSEDYKLTTAMSSSLRGDTKKSLHFLPLSSQSFLTPHDWWRSGMEVSHGSISGPAGDRRIHWRAGKHVNSSLY